MTHSLVGKDGVAVTIEDGETFNVVVDAQYLPDDASVREQSVEHAVSLFKDWLTSKMS